MGLTIHTNNLVSLDGRYVGRVHPQDAQPMHKPRPVRFYTGEIGTFNKLHMIDAPLYVGGPADWEIGEGFTAAVRAIVT